MSKIQEALDKIKASKESGGDSQTPRKLPVDNYGLQNARDDSASIAEMHQPRRLSVEEKAKLKIISSEMADSDVFNAFRSIRTSIIQRVTEASPIIMVTSCLADSGSSFVSLNLAAAISMNEAKTSLLIDCNLTKPAFSDLVVSESILGLKDYLSQPKYTINEIILPTGIPKLRIIPAGTSDDPVSEYFTSKRLNQLFEDIKMRYAERYIIVDTPPVADNADTRILAQVCDYVILVVPYGKVTKDKVLRTARIIGKDKLLGIVFNNEPGLPKFIK